MNVSFRNSYGPRIWVAIMRFDPSGCGQYGNWATAGWWGINYGEQVFAFTTNNRYAAYYAKAANGVQWTGNNGPIYVYHESFNSCIGIGSTAAYATVGMRLIDTGNKNYVVNLIT